LHNEEKNIYIIIRKNLKRFQLLGVSLIIVHYNLINLIMDNLKNIVNEFYFPTLEDVDKIIDYLLNNNCYFNADGGGFGSLNLMNFKTKTKCVRLFGEGFYDPSWFVFDASKTHFIGFVNLDLISCSELPSKQFSFTNINIKGFRYLSDAYFNNILKSHFSNTQ